MISQKQIDQQLQNLYLFEHQCRRLDQLKKQGDRCMWVIAGCVKSSCLAAILAIISFSIESKTLAHSIVTTGFALSMASLTVIVSMRFLLTRISAEIDKILYAMKTIFFET